MRPACFGSTEASAPSPIECTPTGCEIRGLLSLFQALPDHGAGRRSGSVVVGRRSDLASEDGVADHGIEQHQREDKEALAPEHEGETGMWRRRFFDRDRE